MTEQKEKKRHWLDAGDTVYFTAFTKEDHKTHYICYGKITKVLDNYGSLFRIVIEGIADRALGRPPSDSQKVLIGRAFSKKRNELHKQIAEWMKPPNWLTK